MSDEPAGDSSVTHLLAAAERGDPGADDRLYARVYDDLRACAHRQARGHRNATMSTTALVHETYLKLSQTHSMMPSSRLHFMALAARAMRQILVDNARRVGAEKRGGAMEFVTLDERFPEAAGDAIEVLALDKALQSLEQVDARASRVVHLHFFAGMSFVEIGELEGLNERTIKRDWQAARLLLASEMRGADPAA
jgi:RNA polymerase sigma factor (TIGR02999 family)